MNRHCLSLAGLCLVVVGAFALNVVRAENLGVFRSMPGWVVDAIPAAVTHIYRPDLPRYTVASEIHDLYYASNSTELNSRVAAIAAAAISTSAQYRLLGNDDKGIVDFVEWSFRLLGPEVNSIPQLYYGLLALSVSLFLFSFRKEPAQLAAAGCVLFATYQVLPYTVLNSQLNSPLALRCMPLLSLIACLHLTLHSAKSRLRWTDVLILVPQALLLVAVIHMRMTAMWQVLPIVVVALAHAVLGWRAEGPARLSSPAVALLTLFAGLAGLSAYREVAFSAEYQAGQQIMTRVKWHNVYSGFALHPALAAERDLHIDDASVVRDVGRYLERSGRGQAWLEMGGGSENYSSLRWAAYDDAALDALKALCAYEPGSCLATFVLYKPYHIASCMLWFYGLSTVPAVMPAFSSPIVGDVLSDQLKVMTQELTERQLSAAPWSPTSLLFVMALTLLLLLRDSTRVRAGATAASLSVIAAASLAPSVLGYPAPHAMVDSVAAINAALQLGTAIVLSRLPWLHGFVDAGATAIKSWLGSIPASRGGVS